MRLSKHRLVSHGRLVPLRHEVKQANYSKNTISWRLEVYPIRDKLPLRVKS